MYLLNGNACQILTCLNLATFLNESARTSHSAVSEKHQGFEVARRF
jgi:hypothetical protein